MTNENGEKAILKGDNGELVIADWAQEELALKTAAGVETLQTATTLANNTVREAKISKKASDFGDNFSSIVQGSSSYSVAKQMNVEAYGEYVASHADEFIKLTPDEQKEFLREYIGNNTNRSYYLGGFLESDKFSLTFASLSDQLQEIAVLMEENTAALEIENKILTSRYTCD